MKIYTVIMSILFSCFSQAISAEIDPKTKVDEWLGIKIADVEKQCNLKTNYSIDQETFSDYHVALSLYLMPVEKVDTYSPNLVKTLKDVIQRIQNCLNDKDRLDSEGVIEILSRILYIHAKKAIKLDPITEEDENCLSNVNSTKLMHCQVSYPQNTYFDFSENMTIYQTLTYTIGADSTCEGLLPLEECYMNLLNACSPNLKKMFKIIISPPEIDICKNFLQETLPASTEKIGKITNVG